MRMSRRLDRALLILVAIVLLIPGQGCYYHHGAYGYHRNFAYYTPERTSGPARHHRHHDY
jgi:hypothetical protein